MSDGNVGKYLHSNLHSAVGDQFWEGNILHGKKTIGNSTDKHKQVDDTLFNYYILCIVQCALKEFPFFFLQGTQAAVQGLVKSLSCIRANALNVRLKNVYTPLHTHLFLTGLSNPYS